MATVSSTSLEMSISTFSNSSVAAGWKKLDCTAKKIGDLLVGIFVALAKDAFSRQVAYETDIKVLNGGFWYANVYAAALKKKAQDSRLEFFKTNNSFYHGRPPKGFKSVNDATQLSGKKMFRYVLSEGTTPSEALKNVKETLCFIDCQEMIEIAYYQLLLHVLGQKKFDSYFSAESQNPMTLDPDAQQTPLNIFLSSTSFSSTSSLKKGDRVHFANPPFYGYKHINGEGKGFNALCIEEGDTPKFTSFGLDPAGLTEDEMLDRLVQEFNADPIEKNTFFTAELEKKIEDTIVGEDLNEIQNILTHAKSITISKQDIKKLNEQSSSIAGLRFFKDCLNVKVIRKMLEE